MKKDDNKDPVRNLHIYYLCISIILFIGSLFALYLTYYIFTHKNILIDYFPMSLFGVVFLFIVGAFGSIITALSMHTEIIEILTLDRLR